MSTATAFLNSVDLSYDTTPVIKSVHFENIHYPGPETMKSVIYYYPEMYLKGRVYISCQSREVELFDDAAGLKRNIPDKLFNDQQKVQQTLLTTASKLRIPKDMVLNRIKNDKKSEIWEGIFIRKRDGFQYAHDKITIGIWDKTGEIASYKKVYMGTECPTIVKITENDAKLTAWNLARNFMFGDVYKRASQLYNVRAQLLIVQPDYLRMGLNFGEEFFQPIKQRPSRLAWVVSVSFIGDMTQAKSDKTFATKNGEPLDDEHLRYILWRKMGSPLYSFEVFIDADTGKLLYAEHIPLLIANLLK